MPHYFFDTADGDHDTDERGVELVDDDAALVEAVHYAGALLNDDPTMLRDHPELIVTVRSDSRERIAEVRVTVTRG